MNLLPFISLVSLTPSSLGFLSQWSERSELGEWRDVTSPLHMMKGMRKDINNNNKIYKIFFQLLLLLFMSFPTHSLLSHLATLTGRRERVWRRNRETDGTVKWDEREGIVRIGLRLHHSFCLSESNPYNPFSFHSSPWAPLVMLPRFSRGAYHHFLFIEWGGTGAGGNSGTEWDGNGSEVSVRTRSFCKWYVFYFHSPLGTEIPLRNTNRKHVNENSPLPVSPVEPARLTWGKTIWWTEPEERWTGDQGRRVKDISLPSSVSLSHPLASSPPVRYAHVCDTEDIEGRE